MSKFIVPLILLFAFPAWADSSWYRISSTSGTADANATSATGALGAAEGGRTYTTTIDSAGQSVVIAASGCSAWVVTAITVSTTGDVIGCTDQTCDDPTVLPTAALATGDYAYSDGSTLGKFPFLMIDNATSADVFRLFCAK